MMSTGAYPHLYAEGRIGTVSIRNRVIMNPTETLYASAFGECTPQIIEFYRRRAKGGVGMIVLHSIQGNSAVDPLDPYAGSLRIDNDAYIPMLSDLTEAVHREGAKIAALVSIGGGARGNGEVYPEKDRDRAQRVGPSDLEETATQPKTRALTLDEIQRTVAAYGRCAWRARRAGFDAFYIHALGSYLLAEFLSPLYNHRTDAYGGSAENRWRIVFELVEACQREAGKDFPLVLRLSVDEMGEAGRGLEETLSFLPRLEQAGIAAFDVTAGLLDPLRRSFPPIYVEPDANRVFARAVKNVVSVPVINGGRLTDPQLAEAHLREGWSDFVGIARSLIAEPDWVNKVAAGREEELRRCLNCNYCIGQRIQKKLPIRCAFNPFAGREWTQHETPSPLDETVLIVGAGPAGLEAAYTLGMRGCEVDLYEASKTLCGGQIQIASAPPCKQTLQNIARYYRAKLAPLSNVRIHLGVKVDPEMIRGAKADTVLVATGAVPILPPIPGIDGANVMTADAVLRGAKTGKSVVVLGGGQVGAETAHFLSERGKQVVLIEAISGIAVQEEPTTRGALLYLLQKNGVQMRPNEKVLCVSEGFVTTENTLTGERRKYPFDTAVAAFGMRPDMTLSKESIDGEKRIVRIGDAHRVGSVATAIREAHDVACDL